MQTNTCRSHHLAIQLFIVLESFMDIINENPSKTVNFIYFEKCLSSNVIKQTLLLLILQLNHFLPINIGFSIRYKK